MGFRSKLKVGSLQKNNECRAVKKFLRRRLIMNGRRIWNSHQRNKFLRAEASWDILKFRVSEMAFPGVFKRNFPMRTPCWFFRIPVRLGIMPLKCPRHSTTSNGLSISWIETCLNMHSMSFKTGKWMRYNSIRWCLFFVSSYGRRRWK